MQNLHLQQHPIKLGAAGGVGKSLSLPTSIFARGLKIQYQSECAFAVFVRGRAWPAGSIEERPFFMDDQSPLKVHGDR